jgi:broad specificity phosphatase PhoE
MADLWYSSPATAARETAMAFGISPKMSDALADLDYGEWSGHSIEELEQAQPEPLGRWFADPGSGAPGGETFGQLVERLAPWIDAQAGSDGSIFAITHATVIRAALVSTMRLPVDATYQIDIAPLGIVTLSYNQKWRLHELRRL